MSIVDIILKKLNHNGANRRYSRSDAQLLKKTFEPIAENLVEKRFNKIKTKKNEKYYNL